MAVKKYSLEFAKTYFSQFGCELLETEYIHIKHPMTYICKCGKENKKSLDGFMHSQTCENCRSTKIEDVRKFFSDHGCELLETEYNGAHHSLKYICKCGNLSQIEFGHFIRGKKHCKICKGKQFALSLEFVKEQFAKNGCELLENEYVNARIKKMKYKCSCGNISSICYDSFKNGNRCKECGNKKNAEKQKFSHEFVTAEFEKAGCVLLDKYEGTAKPMNYICSCGQQSKISFAQFKKFKKCKICTTKGRSGENHYEWIEDREKVRIERLFRQRCYKLLKMSLNATGRVKNGRTAKLLGYTHFQLKDHIENHPNYDRVKNEKWHIDHIFPIKAFVDYDIKDLSLINCLENLRPTTAFENLSKNGKYNRKKFVEWLRKFDIVV